VRVLSGPPGDTVAPWLPARAGTPEASVTDQGALGIFTTEQVAK